MTKTKCREKENDDSQEASPGKRGPSFQTPGTQTPDKSIVSLLIVSPTKVPSTNDQRLSLQKSLDGRNLPHSGTVEVSS
jgi:hypothetical protein